MHREQRELARAIGHRALALEPGQTLLEVGEVLVDVRRVDDDAVPVFGELVDDAVVHDAPVVLAGDGVLRLAGHQLADVVSDQLGDGGQCVLADEVDLAHVRDVEQSHAGSHGFVLGEDAFVLDRHVPAAKGDHLRAESDVGGVQGRGLERHRGARTIEHRGRRAQAVAWPFVGGEQAC